MESSTRWLQDAPSRPKRPTRRPKEPPRRPQDAPKTLPRRPKTSPRRFQDASRTAPKRLQEGSKTVLPPKTTQNAPKKPPRRGNRAPRAPKTPSGIRKSFQNGQGYLRYAAFLNPPKIPINWRGGTKAQPSSIRRRSAERRARRRAVKLLASIYSAIHLCTSNSPIFQALGNLTAYIPPP